jgi:hypothetical protein
VGVLDGGGGVGDIDIDEYNKIYFFYFYDVITWKKVEKNIKFLCKEIGEKNIRSLPRGTLGCPPS